MFAAAESCEEHGEFAPENEAATGDEGNEDGSGATTVAAASGGGLKAAAVAVLDYGLQAYQERNERQGRMLAELVGSTAFIETVPTVLMLPSQWQAPREPMLGSLPPGNPDFALFMRRRRRVDVSTHAWMVAQQRAKATALPT